MKLPLNFNSPYKAVNIIEFWRRWHMTLSRFLRDYVYFALGGNRKGPTRRYLNLLATMLLGGLWHGAGWTFVFWGALHGVYLIVNHAWHRMRKALGTTWTTARSGTTRRHRADLLAVVVAWVFFRARDFDAALSMLGGIVGRNGLTVPGTWSHVLHWRLVRAMESAGIRFGALPAFDGGEVDLLICWIAVLAALAWFAPNTQQFLWRYSPALERSPLQRW